MGYGQTNRKKQPEKPKERKCWACKGSGRLMVMPGGPKGGTARDMGRCPTCKGAGKLVG
jgi:DnaJ-class molecular chaperone